jgi:TrmH family RNA methyltransferase
MKKLKMLTKNKIKLINSLTKKKFRKKEGLFFCEGEKITKTLLKSNFDVIEIFTTKNFYEDNKTDLSNNNITIITEAELKKISALSTPQQVLALVKIPEQHIINNVSDKRIIALDKIQDPGNLGTIIRIADWFGIDAIVCSLDTVDLFNPKVVQATMGSIFSVNVFYTNLEFFYPLKKTKPQFLGPL